MGRGGEGRGGEGRGPTPPTNVGIVLADSEYDHASGALQ